tara:strand:- start:64 stop:429 length:366 start_codon:yes stop_codon:yes gene_type:complete
MEALRERYQAVVTHPQSDTNQDHLQVAHEAVRVFKGHCSVLGGEFPCNDVGHFQAQVFLPLEEQDIEAKVSMISTYQSQRFDGRPYFEADTIRGLARVRGSQIRSHWAEAFCVLARLHTQL